MREKLTIALSCAYGPNPHLDISMDIKSPGLGDDLELATLTHSYPQDRAIDGYEKLFTTP